MINQHSTNLVNLAGVRPRSRFQRNHDFCLTPSIAPSEQGKGLAKVQLAQALDFCRNLGLAEVLVTCATWNVASRKTILAQPHCRYEDQRLSPDGDTMERYWIQLSPDRDM